MGLGYHLPLGARHSSGASSLDHDRATGEGVNQLIGVSEAPRIGMPWESAKVGRPDVLDECEALELREVEGVDVPEHDRLGLFDAAYEQPPEAVIAHVGMGPLGGEAAVVDGLAVVAGHSLAPGDGAGPVAALGNRRIAAAVLGQGTEQLDARLVQHL